MKVLAIAAVAAMLATSFVTPAAADPIKDREANMESRADLLKILGPIAQGKAPYDAAQVQTALEQLHALAEAATDIDTLWPEGSQGGKSSPRIWEDRAGFAAAAEKFAADTGAAVDAKPADLSAFQDVFGPVADNCRSCHRGYRT